VVAEGGHLPVNAKLCGSPLIVRLIGGDPYGQLWRLAIRLDRASVSNPTPCMISRTECIGAEAIVSVAARATNCQ
jgi:hypothetical protein